MWGQFQQQWICDDPLIKDIFIQELTFSIYHKQLFYLCYLQFLTTHLWFTAVHKTAYGTHTYLYLYSHYMTDTICIILLQWCWGHQEQQAEIPLACQTHFWQKSENCWEPPSSSVSLLPHKLPFLFSNSSSRMTFSPVFPSNSWDCILLVDVEISSASQKTTGNREVFYRIADPTLSIAQQCKPSVSCNVVIIFSCQTYHYEKTLLCLFFFQCLYHTGVQLLTC